MKYNLKNRPILTPRDTFPREAIIETLKWFEGFEKELRRRIYPTNLGEWLFNNQNAKNMGELFTRFINEVLGDDQP